MKEMRLKMDMMRRDLESKQEKIGKRELKERELVIVTTEKVRRELEAEFALEIEKVKKELQLQNQAQIKANQQVRREPRNVRDLTACQSDSSQGPNRSRREGKGEGTSDPRPEQNPRGARCMQEGEGIAGNGEEATGNARPESRTTGNPARTGSFTQKTPTSRPSDFSKIASVSWRRARKLGPRSCYATLKSRPP